MKVIILNNIELRIVDTLGILEKYESNEEKIQQIIECLNTTLMSQGDFGIAAKLEINKDIVIKQVDR